MQTNQNLELDVYGREILRYLIAHKERWTSINEVSKATGFNWITIKRRVKKLEELGLLEGKEYGKKRVYKEKKD